MVGASEARNPHPVHRHALFGLFRRHAVGWKRQSSRGAIHGVHPGQQGIFEHSHVRYPGMLLVERKANAERISPHAHRLRHLTGIEIDRDQAIVELIAAVQPTSIGANHEISQEAIFESVAVDLDRVYLPLRFGVKDHDRAAIRAADVELRAVGRKAHAHVHAVRGSRFERIGKRRDAVQHPRGIESLGIESPSG